MFNKLYYAVFGFSLLVMNLSYAQVTQEDLLKLQNDKEVKITMFSKKEQAAIKSYYHDEAVNEKITSVFLTSLEHFMNKDGVNQRQCEFSFIQSFKDALEKEDLKNDSESLQDYFKLLRVQNSIDDVFYGILADSSVDFHNLKSLNKTKAKRLRLFGREKVIANNNVKEQFDSFTVWPDEESRCTYQELFFIKRNMFNAKEKPSSKDRIFRVLLDKALQEKVISLENYNALYYLATKSKVNKRDLWLEDYMKVILQAKNNMIPVKRDYEVKDLSKEDGFSTERIKRFSRMTRRRVLFRKYDATQITMLAQILKETSIEAGLDPDTKTGPTKISQDREQIQKDGTIKTYVMRRELSMNDQFDMARRFMNSEIIRHQKMAIFEKVVITYEDIIMAALETGYITHDDIANVVKYDDLWNPSRTPFDKISGFVFSIVGYSSFFLPPPFNIAATIAIGVIQGLVEDKHKKGSDNENANSLVR